jgi:hypothetical protein
MPVSCRVQRVLCFQLPRTGLLSSIFSRNILEPTFNVNARLRLPVPTREHDFNEDECMVYTNCSSPVLSSCQGTL